jgi:opacity protein-like surface antigen
MLSFERGYAEPFTSGQGVVLTTGGSASVVSPLPFTPWLSGRASIAYHQNDFTGIGGIPGTTARTERVFGVGVGLKYQIVRWLVSSLQYEYSRTDSSGIISENSVRISLDAAF